MSLQCGWFLGGCAGLCHNLFVSAPSDAGGNPAVWNGQAFLRPFQDVRALNLPSRQNRRDRGDLGPLLFTECRKAQWFLILAWPVQVVAMWCMVDFSCQAAPCKLPPLVMVSAAAIIIIPLLILEFRACRLLVVPLCDWCHSFQSWPTFFGHTINLRQYLTIQGGFSFLGHADLVTSAAFIVAALLSDERNPEVRHHVAAKMNDTIGLSLWSPDVAWWCLVIGSCVFFLQQLWGLEAAVPCRNPQPPHGLARPWSKLTVTLRDGATQNPDGLDEAGGSDVMSNLNHSVSMARPHVVFGTLFENRVGPATATKKQAKATRMALLLNMDSHYDNLTPQASPERAFEEVSRIGQQQRRAWVESLLFAVMETGWQLWVQCVWASVLSGMQESANAGNMEPVSSVEKVGSNVDYVALASVLVGLLNCLKQLLSSAIDCRELHQSASNIDVVALHLELTLPVPVPGITPQERRAMTDMAIALAHGVQPSLSVDGTVHQLVTHSQHGDALTEFMNGPKNANTIRTGTVAKRARFKYSAILAVLLLMLAVEMLFATCLLFSTWTMQDIALTTGGLALAGSAILALTCCGLLASI